MGALKWDKDFALEQAADDKELLEELLEIFKDSFRGDIELIEQGIADQNAEKVSSAAHSIKGASASLGIIGINEVALAIEQDSRGGSLKIAEERLPVLHQLLEEVLQL